jgi:hypothetical protein
MAGRIEEDVYFAGNTTFKDATLNAGSVSNSHVAASAGIATSKCRHKHRKGRGQNGTAAAETIGAHVCIGATGTVVAFKAGSIAAATGNATMTLDLKKNGSSILAAAIVLDNANTARVVEAASISTPGLVVGDWLEVVVTVDAGTGALGTGLYWELEVDEDPV